MTAMRSATPQADAPDVEQLRAEIERRISRVHPSNRHDDWPVTIKISRSFQEFDALLNALAPQVAAPACPRCCKPPSEHSVVDYTVVCKPGVTDLKDEDDGR